MIAASGSSGQKLAAVTLVWRRVRGAENAGVSQRRDVSEHDLRKQNAACRAPYFSTQLDLGAYCCRRHRDGDRKANITGPLFQE